MSSLGLLAARVARARLACSVARDRQIGLAAERDLYQMIRENMLDEINQERLTLN